MRKVKPSRLGKGLPISLENSTKNIRRQWTKKIWTRNRESENESSTDVHNNNAIEMTRIPEITTEELRIAINKLKKRQIPRQQRNQCRRHQSMRRWDERHGETNLQRNHEAEWIHAGGMEESENKIDLQKKEMWKMLETTARSAHCQRVKTTPHKTTFAVWISTRNSRTGQKVIKFGALTTIELLTRITEQQAQQHVEWTEARRNSRAH